MTKIKTPRHGRATGAEWGMQMTEDQNFAQLRPVSPPSSAPGVREALEPFAKIAEDVYRNHSGWANGSFCSQWCGYDLYYVDFDRARAALGSVPPQDSALIDGLKAAIRAAKLALFVIRKQDVMPNYCWESGFNKDLATAENALARPSQEENALSEDELTETLKGVPLSDFSSASRTFARAILAKYDLRAKQ